MTQQTLISVDDSYGLIEDGNCLIFNSEDLPDTERDSLTISQVLAQMGILETTELDLFLNMVIEIVLKLEGGLSKVSSIDYRELSGEDITTTVVVGEKPT